MSEGRQERTTSGASEAHGKQETEPRHGPKRYSEDRPGNRGSRNQGSISPTKGMGGQRSDVRKGDRPPSSRDRNRNSSYSEHSERGSGSRRDSGHGDRGERLEWGYGDQYGERGSWKGSERDGGSKSRNGNRGSSGRERDSYAKEKGSSGSSRSSRGSVSGKDKDTRGSDHRDRSDRKDHTDSRKERDKKETETGKIKQDKESKKLSGSSSTPVKQSNVKSAADLEAQWQAEEEEKRRKEEEEKRLEEEKLKKEQEEKRKAEEAEQRQKEEEIKSIQDYINECTERIQQKQMMREQNSKAAESRPDDSFFSKLDSSLKKNTAFVKKLRNLTESQKESLSREFGGLNLSKYSGEVAAAITEAKLKMSDIPCAVHICSLMFQRYSDFSVAFMENMQKFLITKKDDKINNPSKYRVDLRFFAELVSGGVFTLKEGLPVLANQLSLLINNDKEEHNNLSILSSFCKHCGDDYIGLLPRKYRNLAEKYEMEIPKSQMLTKERQKGVRNLFGDYYQSLCKHLLRVHKELRSIERQNRRILQTKGELSSERKEKYEAALTAFQKLYGNSTVFTDLLDEDLPDLPDDGNDFTKDEESGFDVFDPLKCAEFQYVGDSTLFEDEDARSFYETLPDLKAFIPGICYKESEQAANKDEAKDAEMGLEEDIESLEIEDIEREMETEQQIAEVESKEAKEMGEDKPCEEAEDSLLQDVDDDEADTGNLMKIQLDAYIQSLPNCVNRDLIDKAGIEFCMNFNTKSNRRKLVKALFTVHRTRYDLLPFYSRMVATLYPCMPDVANDLVQLLKNDFKWHVRKKDQINIESKLKTVRFIGELVKFKLYPKSESLHCIKLLMFDFSHHNIEMACALLETCGRFLYRSQDSHHRTKIYLDVMMRKKAALHLDSRYTTMIENAFYYSNPPEVQQTAHKVRPPVHEYIRKLLYKDLSKVTTEKVLRQMRKLNWDDPEIAFYATKSMIAVWNVRYNSVHCAANLLAGLAPYHEHVAIQVVDGVLEDIRIGMEINHPKYNQRRVSCVKFLGELYNYRMVESAVIFKTLYSFVTFGVSFDDAVASPIDPPEHLFRIRLTCVLLETCGQYFDKGSSRKKLDCFLTYFQRYYLYKHKSPIWTELRPFPVDVENLMHDTVEAIRPKLKLTQDYEEAAKAADELENEYKQKLAAVLPIVETDEGNTSEADDSGLSTIQESEEMDDLSQSLSQQHTGEESETSQEEHNQSQHTGSIEHDTVEVNGHVEVTVTYLDYVTHSFHYIYPPTKDMPRFDTRDEAGEDDDDVLESAGEDEDEDQVTLLTGGPKHVKCAEDDDFMTAFDKMMSDNIQARNQESLKVPQLDIAVPMHLKDKNKKGIFEEQPKEKDAIEFVLMTRKGNKQQFTNLNVPISAEFATKYKEREQAEKAEKEKMKQVVLGIHERQEEEDYQEMIAALNRPMPLNTNRDRRLRNYQHPKGAPDADLIFGSKKR